MYYKYLYEYVRVILLNAASKPLNVKRLAYYSLVWKVCWILCIYNYIGHKIMIDMGINVSEIEIGLLV